MTDPKAAAKLARNHRPGGDVLRTNPDWAKLPLFERKGWRRLPFGAFAESVNERVEPADAAEDIYVGLDDLDPGSLHVRRWGKGSDVIGTKLRFRKGDIIFGRRRAYQRKLVVAEMDGICSAHAMVVRAKPKLVLPEFLPFLMMSDKFMNRAVEISVGSLSPTINWTTLKLEEFDLPPLDQQRRIAEVLWAVDAAVESSRSLGGAISHYLHSQIMRAMHAHVLASNGKQEGRALGELFGERRENNCGHLPILAVTISGQVVPRASLERIVIDKTGTEKYLKVCPGDIAYNTMRMWQGSCGVVMQEGIISPAYTALVPRREKAESMFWNYAFHTPELLDWFRRFSTGVAADRWRLYYKSFAKIPVRVPSLSLQRQLVEEFSRSEEAAVKATKNVAHLQEMLQLTVNTLLGGVNLQPGPVHE
jgi:hypothetical protein